jgi:tight adherence protein C
MALAIAVFLFIALSGSITLFGYRRYARAGRVYENLALESAPLAHPIPANPRFFTVIHLAERVGRKLPPSAANASRFRRALLAGGFRAQEAVAIFYGIKLLLASAFLIPAILFQLRPGLAPAGRLFVIGLAVLAGYSLPGLALKQRIKRRQNGLRKALPDALDLMVVCAEAGLALDRSLRTVTQQLAIVHPELADELSLVRAEIAAGIRRHEALGNLATRTQEPEMAKFVAVLTQADRFGTSMGDALRTHAEYLRVRRRQEAEERASKVGVKLIFPIFFFILPGMLLVTAGPAVIQIGKHLGPALMGGH